MFSYYGSKSKVVNYYPPPKFNKIIEPFAGSARYSLKYFDREIIINEKYEVVYNIWKWLQQCNENDIIKLPTPKPKEDIREYNLSKNELDFMGFIINRGSVSPKNKVGNFSDGLQNTLKTISKNLFKIKHWDIRLGDYTDLGNEKATWFIDPPYQFGGEHYKESSKNLNFKDLAEWCKSRNGQIIVCENTKATWMDFKPMKEMYGSQYKTTEAIWSNHKTNYDAVQQSLQF